ncbi:hypothetical protein GN958_ATG19263, partial [Phytophthora infestans]
TEPGAFDLHHSQIDGYLSHHGYWDAVAADGPNDPNDPQSTANETNSHVMRCTLACCRGTLRRYQDKTKRACASEIWLRRDLYAETFTPGDNMEESLDKIVDKRRQIENMNAAIIEEDMVNVVLQGVIDSHRNVIRLFSHNNNGGEASDLS